ncbi:small integral membrane protein 8 [Plakobranchus ocellatus]|uniref:Small integral membrane protein 8 n=1 Tax=Plakobranchus ocellatus TaxID=259542 RepID=A0AAV4D1X4_9GAST|nr:small integral membrane protein 8 [Plakobranchus ocellatus]
MEDSQKTEDYKNNSKSAQPRRTGWASMPSTTAFRAINFELFVKPNKFVMVFGAITFTTCISYIVYMNLTDDNKRSTYVTLDEDGGTTVRPKVSRWD